MRPAAKLAVQIGYSAWRRHRTHAAARPAAAGTFSASPGRKGRMDMVITDSAEAWVSTASQSAPQKRITRLPPAALRKAETYPRPVRRTRKAISPAANGYESR